MIVWVPPHWPLSNTYFIVRPIGIQEPCMLLLFDPSAEEAPNSSVLGIVRVERQAWSRGNVSLISPISTEPSPIGGDGADRFTPWMLTGLSTSGLGDP